MSLVEFLRARLDDKRSWLDSNENRTRNGMCDAPGDHLWEPEAYAEVDAKRRIVDIAEREERGHYEHTEGEARAWLMQEVLAALALPDAGHPDYREDWRP